MATLRVGGRRPGAAPARPKNRAAAGAARLVAKRTGNTAGAPIQRAGKTRTGGKSAADVSRTASAKVAVRKEASQTQAADRKAQREAPAAPAKKTFSGKGADNQRAKIAARGGSADSKVRANARVDKRIAARRAR